MQCDEEQGTLNRTQKPFSRQNYAAQFALDELVRLPFLSDAMFCIFPFSHLTQNGMPHSVVKERSTQILN